MMATGLSRSARHFETRVCRFLALFSPPGFEGMWEHIAPLLAEGRALPDEILALQVRFGMETQDGRARLFDPS
jgi:hypothetical protein